MSSDVTRVMNQARVRQWKKEDQEDLAQETWLRSLTAGHQHEPKYMTGVMNNTLSKIIEKKRTVDRNIKDLTLAYYSQNNSLTDAHLKEDIMKCSMYLNPTQRIIFEELKRNPEASQSEWAENLNMQRRNLGYHLLNIRAIFKSLLNDNKTPASSDRRLNG